MVAIIGPLLPMEETVNAEAGCVMVTFLTTVCCGVVAASATVQV